MDRSASRCSCSFLRRGFCPTPLQPRPATADRSIEDKAGIKDYAAVLYADSATLATLMRNAETVVDKHLAGAFHELHVRAHGETPVDQLPKDKRGRPIRPRFQRTLPEFSAIALSSDSPSDEQIEASLRKVFELAIERDPSPEALVKFGALMRKCIAEGGNAEGLRMAMMAVAISPNAVHRIELGHGPKDEHGRQMLLS